MTTTPTTTNDDDANENSQSPLDPAVLSSAVAIPTRYLTADDILAADDLPSEDLDVPEWGGVVRVSCLSGKDRNAYQAAITQTRNGVTVVDYTNITAKLVNLSLVKPDGTRMFTQQQVNALGEKSSAALERIAAVANRLSGLSDDAVAEAKKDSETTPSGDSSSD